MRAFLVGASAFLCGLVASPSAAAEEGSAAPALAAPELPGEFSPSLTWGFTVASKYLFQGVDYSEGEPVLQPEFGLSAGGFAATLWVNHDLQLGDSNEFDFILSYAWSPAPNTSLSAGWAHYDYPHRPGWARSQEVFCEVALENAASPSLAVAYDYDAGGGVYTTLAASRALPFPTVPLALGGSLYYQRNYYEFTGFPAAQFDLSTELRYGRVLLGTVVSRTLTWRNGDFRGEAAVPGTWVLSLNVAQAF